MDATSRLDRLAVKTGVSLGLLPAADRDAVLAWAAIHMPAASGLDERGVNAVLQAFLGVQARCCAPTTSSSGAGSSTPAGWSATASAAPTGSPPRRLNGLSALLGDLSAERLDARIAAARAAEATERRLRRERHCAA
jgi:hypothetical protein